MLLIKQKHYIHELGYHSNLSPNYEKAISKHLDELEESMENPNYKSDSDIFEKKPEPIIVKCSGSCFKSINSVEVTTFLLSTSPGIGGKTGVAPVLIKIRSPISCAMTSPSASITSIS